MEIEITRMSSKGQVVIPQDIRESMKAKEGTLFAVFGTDDTILLKRMEIPSKEKLIESFNKIGAEGRKRMEKMGIKESDVPKLIHKMRGVK